MIAPIGMMGPAGIGLTTQRQVGGCVYESSLGSAAFRRISKENSKKAIEAMAFDAATAVQEIGGEIIGMYRMKVKNTQYRDKISGEIVNGPTLISSDFNDEPVAVWTDAGENGTGTAPEYQRIVQNANDLAKFREDISMFWVSPGKDIKEVVTPHRAYLWVKKGDEVTAFSYSLAGDEEVLTTVMQKLSQQANDTYKPLEDRVIKRRGINHEEIFNAYSQSIKPEDRGDHATHLEKFKNEVHLSDDVREKHQRDVQKQFENKLKESYEKDIYETLESIAHGFLGISQPTSEKNIDISKSAKVVNRKLVGSIAAGINFEMVKASTVVNTLEKTAEFISPILAQISSRLKRSDIYINRNFPNTPRDIGIHLIENSTPKPQEYDPIIKETFINLPQIALPAVLTNIINLKPLAKEDKAETVIAALKSSKPKQSLNTDLEMFKGEEESDTAILTGALVLGLNMLFTFSEALQVQETNLDQSIILTIPTYRDNRDINKPLLEEVLSNETQVIEVFEQMASDYFEEYKAKSEIPLKDIEILTIAWIEDIFESNNDQPDAPAKYISGATKLKIVYLYDIYKSNQLSVLGKEFVIMLLLKETILLSPYENTRFLPPAILNLLPVIDEEFKRMGAFLMNYGFRDLSGNIMALFKALVTKLDDEVVQLIFLNYFINANKQSDLLPESQNSNYIEVINSFRKYFKKYNKTKKLFPNHGIIYTRMVLEKIAYSYS